MSQHKKTATLPPWAIKAPELRKVTRIFNIDLFHNSTVQVLFRDVNEPIGIGFFRPLSVIRDGRTIIATFVLHADKPVNDVYIMGPWYLSLKAFVLDVAPQYWSFVTQHPNVNYLEADRRVGILKTLDKFERTESWLKQPRGSSSEASDWQQCSSVGKPVPPVLQRGTQPSWSQLPLTPTKK